MAESLDEDYIDMEVSSSNFFCYSKTTTSPPHPFEFPGSLEREGTTSSADELFYKGKLLPLLQNTTSYDDDDNNSTTFNTPLESCNVSPSQSCRVSRELIPDEMSRFIDEDIQTASKNNNKSWSKKLKQSLLFGHQLQASRAYLKSLFTKSGCSDKSCNIAATGQGTPTIAKECLNKYIKLAKKTPLGQIQEPDADGHRRSFSGAIKRHSSSNSSSSSFSSSNSNSNGFFELHLLKRSSSAKSEIESSVQGAIAYCKKSHQQEQQLIHSRFADCKTQERPGLCRG